MDNTELLNMWKQYDEKLEKSLSLNQQLFEEIKQQKLKNALKPAKNYKYFAVLVGIIYAMLVGYFLYNLFDVASIYIIGSVGIHLIVTLIAIGMYIKQICLIMQIDCSERVIQIQQKMTSLKASTLHVIGICFLQLPVFTTWHISNDLIINQPLNFWIIQVPITALFTFVGYWLYRNINIKNVDKKWLKMMFYGAEWNSILKAGQFLNEINNYQKS